MTQVKSHNNQLYVVIQFNYDITQLDVDHWKYAHEEFRGSYEACKEFTFSPAGNFITMQTVPAHEWDKMVGSTKTNYFGKQG